jgi:hypothetical protein
MKLYILQVAWAKGEMLGNLTVHTTLEKAKDSANLQIQADSSFSKNPIKWVPLFSGVDNDMWFPKGEHEGWVRIVRTELDAKH